VAFGLVACSSDPEADTSTSGVGTTTSGGLGGAATAAGGTASTQGSTTMGSTVTSSSVGGATSVGVGGASTSAVGGTTSVSGVGGAGAGGTTTTGVGGASASAGGMGGSGIGGSGAGGTSAGGNGGSGNAEDIDMTGEDFSCIGDWDQVLGFRITNLLGHTDEALAVANNPAGGVYPVGTVIQHLPTEAMVKRATGWSPETKDWEFFLLDLTGGVTTISERGTTAIETSMGQTCVSCHTMAPDEWDFVCNTWGNSGGGDCGFDFTDDFLATQLATDTRCQ
jgi:hypothetical protein